MKNVSLYIESESLDDKNKSVIRSLKEAFTDHIACVIAGTKSKVAGVSQRFAYEQWTHGNSSILLNRKKLHAVGAAYVNATMANALDLDDGHRLTKGHPGAVVIPAILAASEQENLSGKQFLTSLLVGYEVGIRAGIIAHQLRPEYHCTGSWGAVGAAAGVGQIIGLSKEEINHALGIAEYHSTYSPMMRGIDHPAMTKDGIGWGCMTGISAAYLAKHQFTASPSMFANKSASECVKDLGSHYYVEQLYYKPFACCRWAQPAVEALKKLIEKQTITVDSIQKIIIHTFTESERLFKDLPRNTEEAQYSLLFPFACYLLFKEVGPKQVLCELNNKIVHEMMDKIEVVVEPKFDKVFPEKALSKVEVITNKGELIESPIMQAKGDYNYPLSPIEKKEKFFNLTIPIIGEMRSEQVFQAILNIESFHSMRSFTELLNN